MFFRHTQGGDVGSHTQRSSQKRSAKQFFENVLTAARNAELEKREAITERRLSFIEDKAVYSEPHTIYRFPVTQLDNRVKVIVYRLEGAKFSDVKYASINEIDNYYQVVSIEELVDELERANWLSQALNDARARLVDFESTRKRHTRNK